MSITPAGAWNLAKAPALKWSEGDLWNVELELLAGQVYEYKYVVMGYDGTTAANWQQGGNSVLAVQLGDNEIEVYDNWRNSPGAVVVADGKETTRERKLLSWAGDMGTQRAELRRTRMELAQVWGSPKHCNGCAVIGLEDSTSFVFESEWASRAIVTSMGEVVCLNVIGTT